MGQPKGCIPWNKNKKGFQIAWNKGKKFPEISAEKSSLWKGGRYSTGGYVFIYSPTHPRIKKRKYVFEHILVAEKTLGRYLRKDEVVHHVNGQRNDNRPDNLVVMTRAKHLRHHKPHGW